MMVRIQTEYRGKPAGVVNVKLDEITGTIEDHDPNYVGGPYQILVGHQPVFLEVGREQFMEIQKALSICPR